jgi:hypothetical protein
LETLTLVSSYELTEDSFLSTDYSDPITALNSRIDRPGLIDPSTPMLQAVGVKKEIHSSVPLSEFLSMQDQSTESFRVFLVQHGYFPEGLGPAIVQLPDGSNLLCPSNRAALGST